MAYSKNWDLVDAFTIAQASYLWHELDPPKNEVDETIGNKGSPDVAALAQSILAAVDNGTLVGKWHDPLAEFRRDIFKISIQREAVVAFAKAKKQFPAFLFDTILPEPNAQTSSSTPIHKAADAPSKSAGGRPPKYDWDGCYAEIVRIADLDGLPSVQNDLVRELQDWFIARSGDAPHESDIKRKISPVYQYLKNSSWKPRDG